MDGEADLEEHGGCGVWRCPWSHCASVCVGPGESDRCHLGGDTSLREGAAGVLTLQHLQPAQLPAPPHGWSRATMDSEEDSERIVYCGLFQASLSSSGLLTSFPHLP